MTGTAVTTPQTFQERMFERIKDNIGDLIPDEELKKMLDSAMHKAFFEERYVPAKNGYGSDKAPPFIVAVVEQLLKPQIEAHVVKYMEEHPEVIKQVFEAALAKGFFTVAMDYMNGQMQYPLNQLADHLRRNGIPV